MSIWIPIIILSILTIWGILLAFIDSHKQTYFAALTCQENNDGKINRWICTAQVEAKSREEARIKISNFFYEKYPSTKYFDHKILMHT